MRKSTRYTSRIAVVVAFMTVAGASAFADSRHPETTATRDKARAAVVARDRAPVATPDAGVRPVGRQREKAPAVVRSDRSDRGVRGRELSVNGARPEAIDQDRRDRGTRGRELSVNGARPVAIDQDRSDRVVQGRETNGSRPVVADQNRSAQVDRAGNQGRGYEQRDRRGNATRGEQYGRGNSQHSTSGHVDHGKRAPHYSHGQVSKVRPYNNGYRVWIHGSPYPYFVPVAYWRPGYFNVGMTIRVGGYYNPSGWYDYYGDYECNTIAEKRMRGVVEYVDYHRGEILLDVVGGGEVTIELRDRYERVYEGDYVVVFGNWNRWGRFVALDVDVIDRDHRW
ncbi:MAG: hypothetical protein WC538_07190 [Thermoanaerobaculia bacterium]